MLKATLRSLLQRKLRLVLSGLAVVLGVMFVSGAFVLTDTLGRSFDSLFRSVYADTDVQVAAVPPLSAPGTDDERVTATVPASVVDTVRSVPGVAEANGLATADGARLIGANGKVVPSAGPPRFGTGWRDGGEAQMRQGRPPRADGEIAINAALAKAAGVKVGDRVGVLTLQPKRIFTLVGIFGYAGGRDSQGGAQVVAFTEPVAQELMLGERGVYSFVDVRAADGISEAELRDRVSAALGAGYAVKTGTELTEEQVSSFTTALGFFNNILLGFAGVALFVGVFLILNTFSIIVAQRTRELALMRALGAGRRQMIGSVLVEAAAIGLVASVLGLGAGIGIGALLAYVFGQLAGGLELASIGVPAAAIIGAFAVGLIVTVAAALLPAIRAARVPPVAAMREAATGDRPLTRLTIAGAVVLAAGSGLLGLGLSGNAGDATLWTILGGVLLAFIGAALLTPLVARPVAGVIGRLFSWSVPGKLGRLNSGRNPRRTAITAAALMVGIALITGINTIMSSALTSVTNVINEQADIQLLIAGEDGPGGMPTFDPAVLGRAAELPGVRGVSGLYEDGAVIDGRRHVLAAFSDVGALPSMFRLEAASGSIGSLPPDGLLVDSKTAAEHRLSVGSTVTAQFARGGPHRLTVSGIYRENDLFGGFVVPMAVTPDFHVALPTQAFVQTAPGAPVAEVKSAVDALLADSPEVSVGDRGEYIAQQTAGANQVITMIQVLLALAILIAVLGIVNTLALSVLERTRELGLLRAIGLRRMQTMRMVTVEAVVISVFGALLGLAVGAGLGAAVVRALRDEGITTLALPWSQMASYLVIAALVGVGAAVLPAIRAARVNVLDAIAYE
jgi:putative ABC transport system permease protein